MPTDTTPDNSAGFIALGLDSRDIRVYEALYELDKTSLRALAQTTKLNRGTVYEVIKKLSKVGLVSFTQVGSRRHYSAADPEVLSSLIRERHDQLQKLENIVSEYAEELRSQKQSPSASYSASFYEGDEGIATILRDVLQTVKGLDSKTYYVISSRRASNFIYNNFKSFSRQRIKLGIKVRVVSDVPSKERLVLAERRRLTTGTAPLGGYELIYGDKTALISLSDTNELSGIVVTDKGITNMQMLIFEQLWRTAENGTLE